MDIENHTTKDVCHLKYDAYNYFGRDTPRKVLRKHLFYFVCVCVTLCLFLLFNASVNSSNAHPPPPRGIFPHCPSRGPGISLPRGI